ncbi:MAG: DUF1646 domain-containing protein, partial [Candidatus Sumerlaeia bacterium]|nr:DUF1646 domain-containing protein [Candidatus Sumerlaeia bacterium]
MEVTSVDIGLFAVFLIVLIAPFVNKKVEHNLELFLFVMGVVAVTISGAWHKELVLEALKEPILKGIVPAVLCAGLIFHFSRNTTARLMDPVFERLPLKLTVFLTIVILGLISSIITAIIASLLLVELIKLMPIERSARVNISIIGCFSIGLGAVLTPVGEPLSTIAT